MSIFSTALSTSEFKTVATFPVVAAVVESPNPILNHLTEFTSDVPVALNLTVLLCMSAVYVIC